MDPPPESEYWNLVRDFYQSGTFCDLELLTEDGVLKCHQLVLASVSAVLGKCLRRHFRAFPSGSDDNRGSTTVILQDVSSIELRVIVDCIYDRLAGSDGDYLEINPGLSQLLGLCKPDFQKLNFLDRDLLKKIRRACDDEEEEEEDFDYLMAVDFMESKENIEDDELELAENSKQKRKAPKRKSMAQYYGDHFDEMPATRPKRKKLSVKQQQQPDLPEQHLVSETFQSPSEYCHPAERSSNPKDFSTPSNDDPAARPLDQDVKIKSEPMNFIPAAEATVKEEEEQDEGVRNEKPAVVIKKKRQKKKQQRAPRAKKEEEISPLKEEELEEEEYSHEIWPMGFSDEEDALSDGDVKEDDLDAEEQLPYPPSKERSKRPRKGALRKQRSDTKLKSPESKLPLEERQVLCPVCGGRFSHHYISKHIKSIHGTVERKYKCDQCEKAFACSQNLGRHIEGVHGTERNYQCDLCSKLFKVKSNLVSHIKYFHEKKLQKYQCPHCPFKSTSQKALQDTHINPVHLGIKPFECDWCGHKFGIKKHLVRHKKMSCKPKKLPLA